MNQYADLNKNDAITEYTIGRNWIDVKFSSGKVHRYRESNVQKHHLSRMIQLAETGYGLNTYINQHLEVKIGYTEI